jgi:hypothetical protein
MIVVKLMGGLGNQMFQYAIGRKLSMLHRTSLLLDHSFIDTYDNRHIKREFELNVFNLQAKIALQSDLKKFVFVKESKIGRIIHYLLPVLLPYYLISEKAHSFDPEILRSPLNTWLTGFWQTEKYFNDIKDILRSDFQFKEPLQGTNKTLSERIKTCESVSIHVRRGDYTLPQTLNFHGLCSPDYYKKAVDVLSQKITAPELFIFSDDSEWVKQNMKFDFPTTHIDNNTGVNSFKDMHLMSLCKHNIIANSSFSWWGAWLNNNKNKTVIAPKKWINDQSVNTNDVIPDNWLKL